MHRYQHDFDKDIEILIIKGTVMQIEKALINDRLHVSKVSWKFRIATIYNFAVPVKFAIFLESPAFWQFLFFSVCKQNFTVQ